AFAVGEAVPDVGVAGHDAQHLLLAAAPDQDRDLAGRGGVELGEAALDPGQGLREVVDAAGGGAGLPDFVAVFAELAFLETGADAEDEPAAADVVDGARHVGEQVGVAVAVAGDQGADLA